MIFLTESAVEVDMFLYTKYILTNLLLMFNN